MLRLIIVLLLLTGCTTQMGLDEAMEIARTSECGDNLTENAFYNPTTKTWWIELDIVKEGCAPACVVSEDKTAEINWRCTGLLPE